MHSTLSDLPKNIVPKNGLFFSKTRASGGCPIHVYTARRTGAAGEAPSSITLVVAYNRDTSNTSKNAAFRCIFGRRVCVHRGVSGVRINGRALSARGHDD